MVALDDEVACWFKGLGHGYHGRIDAVLRTCMPALISKEVLSAATTTGTCWGKATPKRKEA